MSLDTGVSGIHVTPLGGLTNKNLLITLPTEPPQKFVLKVLAQDLDHYINRTHEAVISKNLSYKGIGPRILENVDTKYTLMDYLYGEEVTPEECLDFAPDSKTKDDGTLDQLVNMLSEIHHYKIDELESKAAKFDTFLENYSDIKRELVDLVNQNESNPDDQAYFLD